MFADNSLTGTNYSIFLKLFMRIKIIFFSTIIFLILSCNNYKDFGSAYSNQIEELSQWYYKQLIPTNKAKLFYSSNNPNWSTIEVEKKQDTLLFKTLIFSKDKITREFHANYVDGVYSAIVREYNFSYKDSLTVGTFSINGRLIDFGYFDKKNKYTLTFLAKNKNIVVMGTEMGGIIDPVDVPSPGSGNTIPPVQPPLPTYPPQIPPINFPGFIITLKNKLSKKPSNDPCLGRDAINERMKLDGLPPRYDTLRKKQDYDGYEHGYEDILDINSLVLNSNSIKTSNLPSKINLDTRWSDNSVTVGYTHNHPQGTVHSVTDLFWGAEFYNQMPTNTQKYFSEYFLSTIITKDDTFVVSIKNIDNWVDRAKEGKSDEFQSLNNKVLDNEVKEWKSGLYRPDSRIKILLEEFGDAINFYKKDENGNYQPIILKDGKLINPC